MSLAAANIRLHPLHQLRVRQAGFSLVELTIVLTLFGLLSWATFSAYETVSQQHTRQLAKEMAQQMQSALRAFALRHDRLPCPDTAGLGYESLNGATCANNDQVGWFPYVSVGLEVPTDEFKARYAVFRRADQNPANDADLAHAQERTGDAVGAVTYQDTTDLIVALNNAAASANNAVATTQPYLTGDGAATGVIDCAGNKIQNVAYWLVLGLQDRDGNGRQLDAPHSASNLCAAGPAAALRPDFDDVVLAESPVQLAGWLRQSLP